MSEPDALPGGDFRLFVQKIGVQGLYALGVIEVPGMPARTEPNLPMARAVVDDLMLLREKTQGNLSDGERMTLEKYIRDLQFLYLERSREKGKSEPPGADRREPGAAPGTAGESAN